MATDVSRRALQHAERGVYSARNIASLNPRQVENYFAKIYDQFLVKPRVRNMVTFAQVNLAQGVYMGRFDIIFCMNVLIYFSAERRAQMIQRFWEYLEPGGFLFLGHAETAAGAQVPFETIVHGDCRVYQKSAAVARRTGEA